MTDLEFPDSYLKDNEIFEKKYIKKSKTDNGDFSVLNMTEYELIKQHKYNISQLKNIPSFFSILSLEFP